jgi:putative tricarboxylic transport membrane protein
MVMPARKLLGRPDVASALVLLAVALLAWMAARDLPWGTLHQPGAGFFPKSLALLLGSLSIVLLARGGLIDTAPVSSLWPEREGRIRVAIMLAALLAYVLLLEPVGYLIATAGLFLVLLRWVGRQGWAITLGTAALAAVGSYVLFARWLMVSLPAGLWAP